MHWHVKSKPGAGSTTTSAIAQAVYIVLIFQYLVLQLHDLAPLFCLGSNHCTSGGASTIGTRSVATVVAINREHVVFVSQKVKKLYDAVVEWKDELCEPNDVYGTTITRSIEFVFVH